MGPMLLQFGLFCDVLRSLDQFPLVHFMSYYCQSNQGRQSWGLGGRDTSDFGLGVVEGRWGSYEGRGRWTGFGKQYSVFCTESTLENVFFVRRENTFGKNRRFMRQVVKAEYLRRKANFKKS